MQLVYYSLASAGDGRYERQWLQSIRSLRTHNRSVQVHLVHYNAPSDQVLREAEQQRVTMHRAGDYRDRLEEVLPGCGSALVHYPVLHKLLSLQFLPVNVASQVLYLDCDTYFFRDVAELFSKYQTHHFYAREEPSSRRSADRYEPWYINEETLIEICNTEGLKFIPPYNNGVFILNRGLAAHLFKARKAFLCYACRLLLGLCENEQLAQKCEPAFLRELIALRDSHALAPLRYASDNNWIADLIATLFTLGSVADVTHEAFLRTDCSQNGEPFHLFRPILIHYFSKNEDNFFQFLKRLQAAEMKIK